MIAGTDCGLGNRVAHPKIAVRLDSSPRLVDLHRGEADSPEEAVHAALELTVPEDELEALDLL
mgnify:CR=1 FL=1